MSIVNLKLVNPNRPFVIDVSCSYEYGKECNLNPFLEKPFASQEIHGLLRQGVDVEKIASQLSPWASALFEFLPPFIRRQVNLYIFCLNMASTRVKFVLMNAAKNLT